MTFVAVTSRAHAGHAAVSAHALVGRHAEIEDVAMFVDTASVTGGAMHLTGAAGAGKSRLLAHAVRMAQARSVRVLTTTGADSEVDVGHACLQMLLAPIMDRVGELPAAHASALEVALGLDEGPSPRPLVLGSAVLGLLNRVAEPAPVLLVVDDLDRVDGASAGVLRFLARRLGGTRVGLLAASRTFSPTTVFTDDVVVRHLTPLSDSDAGRLVAGHYPALPTSVRSKVVQEARGNPLALLELGRDAALSLRQDSRYSGSPVAERLRATFRERFEALDHAARHALLLVALDGRQRLRDVVALGIDVSALSAAEGAGLVVVDTTAMAVTFPHPLIRSAVVQAATASERREAHLAIADAVDDPDRRAWHLADAASGPDPQVATMLEGVAQRSLEHRDPGAAVGALVRAARLSPNPTEERRRLAEAAFRGTEIAGELSYAARLLADAGIGSAGERGSLHAAAAAASISMNGAGGIDRAYRLLEDALEAHDPAWSSTDGELVDALTVLVLVCHWAGDARYWRTVHRAISRFGGDVPEPVSITAVALADVAGSAATVRGRLAQLIRNRAATRDDVGAMRLAVAAGHLDLVGEGRDSAWRVIAAARGGGGIRCALDGYAYLCTDDFGAGRWREQQHLANEGLVLSREHGYSLVAGNFLYHRALVEAVQGMPEEAFRWARELTDVTSERHAHGAERAGNHPRTLAAVAQGDWESAFRYAEGLSPAGTLLPHAPHAMWVAFDLVESAVRTGRPDAARAHAAAMVAADLPSVSPRMAMMTLGARALVAEGTDAASLFEAAVTAPDAEAWPFDLARVRLAYGEWLRRNAETLRARDVLHQGLAAFERLGATAWAERARQNLRAARDPANRAGGDLSALTAQERAIVELAAHGLSNKEIGAKLFLSPRTVSGHLYRAFPKMGVTSRAALSDVLASRTPPPW